MNFQSLATPAQGLADVNADTLLVLLVAGADGAAGDSALKKVVDSAVKLGDLELKAGRSLYVHAPEGFKAQRLLVCVARDASSKALYKAATAGCAALKGRKAKHLAVALPGVDLTDEAAAEAVAMAAELAGYAYTLTKANEPVLQAAKLTVVADKGALPAVRKGLARGSAIGAGMNAARECANRPGNHCTPTWLGEEAQRLGKAHGFAVQVLDRKAIEKLGMGSFLAVAQGSEQPPRFIVMTYNGAAKGKAPVVLVGKGITFDTGGISLKPAPDMDEMKFDMGGAASVIGAMKAIATLKPKINVVALVPTCENMPDGRAVKPGDVVKSMSGQTIEILNTDAEGRLILCDALTYAERFKPQAVVDVATLTGACIIALGHLRCAMYASDDELAGQLTAAADAAHDPCWRMPLDDEYEEGLKSNFADVANVAGRAGGSITAAKFLQRFAKAYPWAHLDVAGTAHKSGAAKGATGRPVGLLTHFVLARAAKG